MRFLISHVISLETRHREQPRRSHLSATQNLELPLNFFSKIEVNGENTHPLYKYLKEQKGFGGFDPNHPLTPLLESGLYRTQPDFRNTPDIKWNFTKFLIDRDGNVVERFEPTTF